jgi:Cu2+-exporting ATPase/Cu+-exporting ATPase
MEIETSPTITPAASGAAQIQNVTTIYSGLKSCAHCSRLSPQIFCCSGCEFVYGLLKTEGLDQYYEIRDANPPSCPIPVQPSSETFDFCDDPAFIAKLSPDGQTMLFFLEGLNCSACLWLLEKISQFCADASYAQVNMANSTISVTRIAGGSFAKIAQTLNQFGYRPHPIVNGQATTELQKNENRRDLMRIGIAAGATGNIMILAVSLYGGADGDMASYFKWLATALACPVLTWCAWPFYKSAWNAIKTRHMNIDVPIVAAILAGIVLSFISLLEGGQNLYFDSLSMLVFLLLSSRFWLKRIQQHHLDASHLEDYLLMGTVNRILENGEKEKVSSLSLKKDDIIELGNDQVIPADGHVISGLGLVQTAVLTGEATPINVEPGDRVEAGTRSMNADWRMTIEGPAAESRLARILRDAERSTRQKPALVRLADRVSQWFMTAVLLAAATTALWFLGTNPHEGFNRALALVIVTCPCVFGMAIPLSMSLAIRGAAKHGMILKSGDVIERLTKIKILFFDKTGTLTKGELKVKKLTVSEGERASLAMAHVLEFGQPHPVARAICRAIETELANAVSSEEGLVNIRLLKEGGITGETAQGRQYSILPVNREAPAEPANPNSKNEIMARGQIKAHYDFIRDQTVLAQFEIGDELKENSIEVMNWARRESLSAKLLSGDRSAVVSECGRQLGLDSDALMSDITPENKATIIKQNAAMCMMIGDGANDAAALAAASIGVAVRGSMDVSLRAADVYLTDSELDSIPKLFEIGRRTRNAIARNLTFSATFNIASGALAAAGLMSPLWAAVLMPISSLTVLASALYTGQRLEKL